MTSDHLGEKLEAYNRARAALNGRAVKLRDLLPMIEGVQAVRLDELGWLVEITATADIRAALLASVEAEIADLESAVTDAEAALGRL